jgi:hypothetical protein
VVLLRKFGLEFARLSQLRVDVGPLGGEGGGALGPAPWCGPVPGLGGTSSSPASAAYAVFAWSLASTTKHSRVGS